MEILPKNQEDLIVLPTEVWERVFGYLDGYSLGKVLLTCHLWRNVADSCEVWSQVCDSFWDNIDGSRVSITHLPLPPGLQCPTGGSLHSSRTQGSSRVGPLRRSHGQRKQLKDSLEVLHQVVYQHSYHPQSHSSQTTNSAAEISDRALNSSNSTSLTTSTVSGITSSNSNNSIDGINSRSSSSSALGDSGALALALSNLNVTPHDKSLSLSVSPSKIANERQGMAPIVESELYSAPPAEDMSFRELDLQDAPDEDILRKWLPSEEEITYILKESHQVTVNDFKQYYRLISTCLIVDPSIEMPHPAVNDPMTIVTPMLPLNQTQLRNQISLLNQQLWTFGSPHRPLRRLRIFASVQKAINHARQGDFIYLRKGYYTEAITVTQPIRLCGQMSIRENISLQAEIKSTIHWKAPILGLENDFHIIERKKSPRGTQNRQTNSLRLSSDYLMEEDSNLVFHTSSPAVIRGSISCLNFTTHNPQTMHSIVVHPCSAVDIHHSLFQNRTQTAIKLAANSSVSILRTSFSGNANVFDLSSLCESLGLYKNMFRDKPSPDTIVKLVEQASRLFAKIEKMVEREPFLPSEVLTLQQFSEVLMSFIDMALVKELRSLTISSIMPSVISQMLYVLSKFYKIRIVTQNLMYCLSNLSKLEHPRNVMHSHGTFSIVDQIMAYHLDDIYIQSEACTTIWNLAAFPVSSTSPSPAIPAQANPIDSLNLVESILMALERYEDRKSFVSVGLAALWNLSWTSDKSSVKIAQLGLDQLFALQKCYSDAAQIQINIYGVLSNISTQKSLAANIAARNGMDCAISSLKHHSSDLKLFKACFSFISLLFHVPGQKKRFVDYGGVMIMLDALETFFKSPELLISADSLFSVLADSKKDGYKLVENNGLFVIIKSLFHYFEQTRAVSRQMHLNNLPSNSIESRSQRKSIIELNLLQTALSSTSDVKYVLSVIKEMAGILHSSSKTDSDQIYEFYASSESRDIRNIIKDAGESTINLFVSSILCTISLQESILLEAMQSGIFEVAQFITNYLHRISTKRSGSGVESPNNTDTTARSFLSPTDKPSSPQTRRPTWKLRRPSTGSPYPSEDQSSPPSTESTRIDIIKTMLHFFSNFTTCFSSNDSSRVGKSQYSDYFVAFKHFVTTLRTIVCPTFLLKWAEDQFKLLKDPLMPTDCNAPIVDTPVPSEIQLDPNSKTACIILHSDQLTIYNPHGQLESIRSNHFVREGRFYYEVEIISVDGSFGTLPGTQATNDNAPSSSNSLHPDSRHSMKLSTHEIPRQASVINSPGIQVGWTTARADLKASKLGIGNSSYGWSCDPFRRVKWHLKSSSYLQSGTPIVMYPQESSSLWKSGDIIQCAIDLGTGSMYFGLNGRSNGMGFTSVLQEVDLSMDQGFYPSISVSQGCEVRFRFKGFRYPPNWPENNIYNS